MNYEIVNKKFNRLGVLDFFKYVFRTDIFVFNWIEGLRQKRFGKLQVIVFYFFLFCAKLVRKKIIWFLHDKYSHFSEKDKWVRLTFELVMRKSDAIITHSNDGIEFLKKFSLPDHIQIKYFPHPVHNTFSISECDEKKIDFLIWGTIFPYKGIVEFLEFISAQNQKKERPFEVLIIGRCYDENYKNQLRRFLSINIRYCDTLLKIEEIAGFAKQSKFILFTYLSASVLSSGALMDSIRMRSIIIGPNYGSFRDLSKFSFVKTYNSYDDIIDIYKKYEPDVDTINRQVEEFCQENTWGLFAEKMESVIERLYSK